MCIQSRVLNSLRAWQWKACKTISLLRTGLYMLCQYSPRMTPTALYITGLESNSCTFWMTISDWVWLSLSLLLNQCDLVVCPHLLHHTHSRIVS